jgi:hypothetical protein
VVIRDATEIYDVAASLGGFGLVYLGRPLMHPGAIHMALRGFQVRVDRTKTRLFGTADGRRKIESNQPQPGPKPREELDHV